MFALVAGSALLSIFDFSVTRQGIPADPGCLRRRRSGATRSPSQNGKSWGRSQLQPRPLILGFVLPSTVHSFICVQFGNLYRHFPYPDVPLFHVVACYSWDGVVVADSLGFGAPLCPIMIASIFFHSLGCFLQSPRGLAHRNLSTRCVSKHRRRRGPFG